MPVIAVDVDDVLADYVGAFLPFLDQHGQHIVREDIRQSLQQMGVADWLFADFLRGGYLRTLKRVPHAYRALTLISKYAYVVAVTSRPIECQRDTLGWLVNYFPMVRQVRHTRDKSAAHRQWNAWALVDDQVQYAEQVDRAFVLAQPWNADWTGRRGTWDQISQWILNELCPSSRTTQ